MKKIITILLLVVSGMLMAQNKKIVTTYGEIVQYDIRVTTAERDALPNKTFGMMIFNTTTDCHEFWNGSDWYNYCWKGITKPDEPSSGGSAIVSAYTCSTGSSGKMTVNTPVSGVTQTVTAMVTTAGSYNITATANGVTFSASGDFPQTGIQDIVLTATGTPTAMGSFSFPLSGTPSCSFNRTVDAAPSSGGSAIVSGFNCSTSSSGIMRVGEAVSGVTQTVTATVTTPGTYYLTATANGVTFSGLGVFVGAGDQNIVLTATGTPEATGDFSFPLNSTPTCSFDRKVDISLSTGGSGVVSGYTCSTSSNGTMAVGVPVSGVTQTITATVTSAGTYNITATANGVTFSGTGTFPGTGSQNVVLTATGTPIAPGSSTFPLNSSPGCSFNRTTDVSPSSGGSAVISAFDCSTASNGTMTAGTSVSGVTQTITATVEAAGTYNIFTTVNGVTFSGNGTLTGTGSQTIVLTASGTPVAPGIHSYALGSTPTCSFDRVVAIVIATQPTTPAAVCTGTGVQSMSVGAAGATTYVWRKGGVAVVNGGVISGQGTPTLTLTNPTAANAGSYDVVVGNGSSTATSVAVTTTVNAFPTITGVTPASRCGAGSVNLGASASAGTINWYNAATGGSYLGSGTTYSPTVSGTTTYYVEASNLGCTSASRTAVTATVNPAPTITGVAPASRCGAGAVTLGASASAGTINWYNAATGGSYLGSGTSYSPTISGTTTFYVDATNGSCTTPSRTAVTATINAIPYITGVAPASRCDAGVVTLSASASEGTIKWYDGGGSYLGAGASFSPSISGTTTYYVDATNAAGCVGSRVGVTATVNNTPSITGTTPGSRVNAGSVALGATASGGTINWFDAGGTYLGSGSIFNTPSLTATTTFYAEATNAGCTSARTAVVATVTLNEIVGPSGKTWMAKNLGAPQAATSANDYQAYGWLYQWGRGSDGHQKVTWTDWRTCTLPTYTITLSTTDTPGHGKIIWSRNDVDDWRVPGNAGLWQGINGKNNPCPAGFRVPTINEINTEFASAGATSYDHKFEILGVPDVQWVVCNSKTEPPYYVGDGSRLYLWSSTPYADGKSAYMFKLDGAIGQTMVPYPRADAAPVRCIKD